MDLGEVPEDRRLITERAVSPCLIVAVAAALDDFRNWLIRGAA